MSNGITSSETLYASMNWMTDSSGDGDGFANGTMTDACPHILGEATPGSLVTIYDYDTNDGQIKTIGTVQADENGQWTFVPPQPLADGTHALYATASNTSGTSEPSSDLVIDIDTSGAASALSSSDAAGELTAAGHSHEASADQSSTNFLLNVDSPAAAPPQTPPSDVLDAHASEVSVAIHSVYDKIGDSQGIVDGKTDDARPRISGEATPDSLVTIYDGDNKVIGTAHTDEWGTWAFVPPMPLSDGPHTLHAVASNEQGTSTSSNDVSIYVDTSGVVPGQLAINAVYDDIFNQYIDNGASTDDRRPTVEGTAPADSLVTIKDGATVLGAVQADAWGHWSFTPDVPLYGGVHDLVATIGSETSAAFSVETSGPGAPAVPTIASVYDNVGTSQGYLHSGATTDDNVLRLQGTAKPGELVTILDGDKVLGSFSADGNGNWFFDTMPPLSGGDHHLKAVTSYGAPYAEASAVFDVHVEQPAPPPPTPTIDSVYDNVGGSMGYLHSGATTDDTQPTLRGTGTPNSTITIMDGTDVLAIVHAGSNGEWTYEPKLDPGSHHLTVVSDAGISAPFDITVQAASTAPTVAITSVYDDVGASQGYLKPGDTTDDTTLCLQGSTEKYGTITILDGDKVIGSFVAIPGQPWTYTTPPLGAGEHQLKAVWSYGAPYAESSATFDVTVAGAPPPPVAAPVILYGIDSVGPGYVGRILNHSTTDDSHLKVYGRGAANTWLSIKLDDVEIGTVKTDDKGNWSFKPEAPMEVGTHTITASLVGGEVGPSGSFVVTVESPATTPGEAASQPLDHAGNMAGLESVGLEQHHDVAPSHPQPLSAAAGEGAAIVVPVIAAMLDDAGATKRFVPSGVAMDDTQPKLFGTAEPGSLVTIKDGDRVIGTVHADTSGGWSFTTDSPLENGVHHITAVVNGQASYVFDVNVDPAASALSPVPQIGAVTDNVTHFISSAPGQHIHDAHPSLSGQGQPHTTVTILDGNKVLGEAQVNEKGLWSFTPDSALEVGEHHLVAVSDDGQSGVTLVVFVDPLVTTPNHAESLSLSDVLGTGEGDLFASIHAHDNAQLSVHDIDAQAATADSMATTGASVAAHDTAALNANLVLPHEQAHVVM